MTEWKIGGRDRQDLSKCGDEGTSLLHAEEVYSHRLPTEVKSIESVEGLLFQSGSNTEPVGRIRSSHVMAWSVDGGGGSYGGDRRPLPIKVDSRRRSKATCSVREVPPPPAYREASRPAWSCGLPRLEHMEALVEPLFVWSSATKEMYEREGNRPEDFTSSRRPIEKAELGCVQSNPVASVQHRRDWRDEVTPKDEENSPSQFPGKERLATGPMQRWLRSRQTERDHGHRTQVWIDEDQYDCLEEGSNRDVRPGAWDFRFRHPETAPRLLSGTGVLTEVPQKRIDQLGDGHHSHPSRRDYCRIWDRAESELSSGGEPEPVMQNDQWGTIEGSRTLPRSALADRQLDRHRFPPQHRLSPKVKRDGARSRTSYSIRHRVDAPLALRRRQSSEPLSGDQLEWSLVSDMDSSDDEPTIRTGDCPRRKWGPETATALRPPTKEKRDMKLERFDGTVRVESFLAKFEICSRRNRWSEAARLDELQCALTGDAAQFLWDMGAEGVETSDDLIRQLRARYGSANQIALYQTQLRLRKRKYGETLTNLVNDIRKLVALAFPGSSFSMKELVARESFLEALNDRELSLKIKEREPKTLEDAYQMAMRLEAYAVEHDPDNSGRRVFLSRKVTEGQTRPETDPEKFLETLQAMSKLQQASFEELFGEITSLAEKHKSPPCSKQSNTIPHQRRSKNRSIHRQQNDIQELRRRFGNKKCFQCREVGHLIAKCPHLVSGDAADDDQETFRTVDKATDGIDEQDGVYLRVILSGKMHRALVDTGSVSSLIPEGIIPFVNLRKTDRVLRAANGVEIEVMGETFLDMQVGGLVIPLNFLVVRDVPEVILGMNWIRKYVDSFDLKDGKITIQGRALSLSMQPYEPVPNETSRVGVNNMASVHADTCESTFLDTTVTETDCPRIVDQPRSKRKRKRKHKMSLSADDQRDVYQPLERVELSQVGRVMTGGEGSTKVKRRLGYGMSKRGNWRRRSRPSDVVDLKASEQTSFHNGDRRVTNDRHLEWTSNGSVIPRRLVSSDAEGTQETSNSDEGGWHHDHRQWMKGNQPGSRLYTGDTEPQSSDKNYALRVDQTSGSVLRRVRESPADNDKCRSAGQNDETARCLLRMNKTYV